MRNIKEDMNGLVLVVDDNQKNREICQVNLEMEDYIVCMAENGKEGIAAAKQHKPDVILLDIMMPVMNGCEALKILKSNEDLAHIPVLMVTAKAEVESVVEFLEMGAQDYLKKPFDVDELVARVNTMVRMKKAEEQLKKSISILEHKATLSSMTAGLFHDINNRITAMQMVELIPKRLEQIEMSLSSMQKEELNSHITRIKEIVNRVFNNLSLTENLASSVLEFDRNAGKTEKEPQAIDLLVKPAVEVLKDILKKMKIEVKVKVEQNIFPVMCNAAEIQSVVLNLVQNGLNAMEGTMDGLLHIELKNNGPNVDLEIEDNGCGIPQDIQPKIFEPHFTTRKENGGTGLGLDNVKRIIEGHNGKIKFESKVGKGTKFFVTFPALVNKEGKNATN